MANYDTSIRAKILVDTKDLERAEKEIESLTKKLDAAKKFEEIGGSPEQAKALGYNVKALEKQLADAIYNVSGKTDIIDSSNKNATYVELVKSCMSMVNKGTDDTRKQLKSHILAMELIANEKCNLTRTVTRAEASVILKDFIDIM